MKRGHIRHYRAARDHWLHENSHYYMAWFDIILLVNHTDKKLLIDKELITCKRGESYYSLNSWVELLGKWWTLQKVRTFFKLLEADNMIICSGLRKTTRLSVVNYEKYNTKQHTGNTQVTDKQHTGNTQVTSTKELLSITKELPSITKKEKEAALLESFEDIFSIYPRKTAKQNTFTNFKKLLKKYSVEDLKKAVDNYREYCRIKGIEKDFAYGSNNFFGQKAYYLDYLPENYKEPKINNQAGAEIVWNKLDF